MLARLRRFREPVPSVTEASRGAPASVADEGWWLPLWTLTALLIFIALIAGQGQRLWLWLDRPVTQIAVKGDTYHLDRKRLAEDVAAVVDATLLQLDIAAIRDMVAAHPWVREVSVGRDWPQTLQITVREEVPVARWGEKGLLNHQGDIFWPELKPEYEKLPRLSGPATDTATVMVQFHDLNQMFRQADLTIKGLNLEARGAWTLILDNGIRVVVGRENINERLQRFLRIYRRELSAQAERIEQVDIRYFNGVAVKWRPEAEEDNTG
ncbi:cell division protein FtsQ/DivIB [Marinobacterium jannaschii]|uniref:cell division protein FtsQ/DivIB n=1 Tax=Marinobacterium jannaschii TaxID=64970 RepID=UPI000B04C7DF|nr:cell division protein FtsQ/DivIB [Marinobacterium jannaschii]